MPIIILVLSFVSPMLWASPTLKLGAPAPTLENQLWVQGPRTETFAKGQIYVVEFWGTTCPPCVETLPHMVELSRVYKDKVHFIGVAPEIDTEESVKEFLKTMDPPIDYALTVDTHATAFRDWLEASGTMGIPSVFVIDRDGTVAYIGYPTLLDREDHGYPLSHIVAGTWKQSEGYAAYAEKFNERAEQTSKLRGVYAGLQTAMAESQWEQALKTIDAGILIATGYHRSDLELHRAELLTHHLDRGTEAAAVLPKLAEDLRENPQNLGRLLELVINEKLGGGNWDFELGHRVAMRILSLIDYNANLGYREGLRNYQAMLLPPVSKFYFIAGLPTLAMQVQRRAIASAQAADYDPSDLIAEFHTYEKAALSALTNWGETFCVDGRCYLLGPSAKERKILDRLLAFNPTTDQDVPGLFEDGHLRVEVVAAPAYLKEIPGGAAESALFAVATNPLAPKLLRKTSLATLGALKSRSADLFLKDIVERALEASPADEAMSLQRELLPAALDALGDIGDEAAPSLRKRCASLLDR